MTATIRFGPFLLIPAERRLEREGTPVMVGGRALDLLIALTERPGEVVLKRELMDRVWPDQTVEGSNLRVHVVGLRKALGDRGEHAQYIVSVPGRGYCFVAPTERFPVPVEPSPVAAQPAPISPPRAPLPPRLSRMVGRDHAVSVLAALVREQRFVSVVGPGGMGKTTVATAVAHELADAFEGLVAFVDLASLTDPALVTASVSGAVGASLTEPDPLPGLLAFLAPRRMLVVLDNCEHLADAVAVLAEQLYTHAPGLHLLATSREALRTEVEQIHLLEPIEGPSDLDLDAEASELLRYPAVQLFMERAAAGGYREPLDEATAPLVARMCHHLDGIALAIELVASRLGTYGVQRTADLLDNRFQLLWRGRRRALPRHQTLHAMLDWSFNLLSEPDRTVFTHLGVFAGPFDLAAVRAVAGGKGYDVFEVEQSLDHLVEKSLVWTFASETSSFYRLPHVARDFVLTELARRDDKREVAARHARHILGLLQALRPREQFDEIDRAFQLSSFPFPCLRTALNWSFSEEGDGELAIDLAVAAAPVWLRIGLFGECRLWSERALNRLADRDKGAAKELALQEALAVSVFFTSGAGEVVAAALDRGLALSEALGESSRQQRLLAGRFLFSTRSGAFGESLEIALRAFDIAQRLGDPKTLIMAEWMLGSSYHFLGRQKEAQSHCDRGFAGAPASALDIDFFGHDHHVRTLATLGAVHWIQGRWDRGVAFNDKAIQVAQRRGDPVGLCGALIFMANLLLWNGSLDEAETSCSRLEKLADHHAMAPYQASALALRGRWLCARGEHEAAIERLREGLARLHEVNYLVPASGAQRALAESLMHAGDPQQALVAIDDAIDRAERSGGKVDLSELLRTQAEIRLRTGDADGAEAALRYAISVADEQGAASWRLRSGEALARLWLSQGRAGAAQMEVQTLLALLEDCGPGEPLTATRERLLATHPATLAFPGSYEA